MANKTEKELSAWLGEVLNAESHGHIAAQSIQEMEFSYYHCKTCGEVNFEPDSHCSVIDPIPLDDWSVAMKWRDWAVAEYGASIFADAMNELWKLTIDNDLPPAEFVKQYTGLGDWILSLAKPRDYEIAAAKCKENE